MGNCLPSLAHEPRRRKSKNRPHGAVAPLHHRADEPEKGGQPQAEDDGNKVGARVKVVMTKEAAAVLLSMLAGSNGRKVESMLRELKEEKGRSFSSAKPASGGDLWRPTLESIPEN
ncbi:uncharacterized protein LOC103981744 [Musa acuminata AAA Group]|uniref:uncharacterized protein LOC103981744 n=1 Tax=Musa acuminata AAA Group TaxID=214697 RepID=UPI0031D50A4A